MQLIELNPRGILVFVGDTHGDFDASKKVINKYLKPNVRICFLGDYVDRGGDSKKNIDFLLKQKKKHPKKLYLLKGNHEGKMIYEFGPSSFWDNLEFNKKEKYGKIFGSFPLALSVGSIIATHSSLPEIKSLNEINNIKDGDYNWHNTVWRDFLETEKQLYRHNRAATLQSRFDKIMDQINKKILIRSHNSNAPTSMYDGRCITIFTSSSHEKYPARTIAIVDFTKKKEINSIEDLIIEKI